MYSKKYKFLNTVIEIVTPEQILDENPFSQFLCEDEPHYTVIFEYGEQLPPVHKKAIADNEIAFFTEGEKSFCWYKKHGKDGYFAYRVSDGYTQKVIVLEEYRGKLWNGILFNLMGFEEIIAMSQAVVLHASMIEINGEIVLFTAPCGTGKSTQASLWEKFGGACIVNGDKALVKCENGNIIAGGLPFSGSSNICKNISAPLKAVISLGQACENIIRKMSEGEAFVALLQGNYRSAMNENASKMVTDTIEKICRNIPVYKFDCLPDESAVERLAKELCL